MTENIITHLEGFDAGGIHCGYAQWLLTVNRWQVRARGMRYAYYCDSEEEAERVLRSHGAALVQRSDGIKR